MILPSLGVYFSLKESLKKEDAWELSKFIVGSTGSDVDVVVSCL